MGGETYQDLVGEFRAFPSWMVDLFRESQDRTVEGSAMVSGTRVLMRYCCSSI